MPAPEAENHNTQSTDRESDRINFSWLVRLRWGAIAGQVCTIAVARMVMEMNLDLVALFSLVAIEVVSNLACRLRLGSGRAIRPRLVAAVMAFDVLMLTGLLALSGGSYNPFSFLYLVNIALAAVVLEVAWAWALLVLSAVSSGLLFSGALPLSGPAAAMASHAEHLQTHLQGMWVAFLVAAVFIVYFCSRVRGALAARERDLAAERAAAARNERLTSLATLAAGAAHELATPLATISVVARELERYVEEKIADPVVAEDIGVIRAQVDRCRGILDQMSIEAGSPRADAARRLTASSWFESAIAELGHADRVRVTIDSSATGAAFKGPPRALAQALRGTLKNALEASSATASIELGATVAGRTLTVVVRDHGSGMSPEVLARAAEPFFTTKPTGKGMGLGLFLTRTVVERLGGTIRFESQTGVGTMVSLTLPLLFEDDAIAAADPDTASDTAPATIHPIGGPLGAR